MISQIAFKRHSFIGAAIAALLLAAATPAAAQTVITLKKEFVETYKNRITIDADFFVDKAHKHPNSAAKDGDMHVAGRSPHDVGLATVAEIMNAKEVPAVVQAVHDAEGSGQTVDVVGVWRLWPEHGGQQEHNQGDALAPFSTTNPDHVFEIHPVTSFGGTDVVATLHKIEGFQEKDADDAFRAYERTPSEIRTSQSRITLETTMVGFNYVHFKMRLIDRQQPAPPDGEIVYASILDLGDELLVQKRRVIFVKDTQPLTKEAGMAAGDCMEVLGIPRINLAVLSWRVRNAQQRPEVLTWGLPYEIIAVGVYDDQPAPCGDDE